MKDDVLFWAGRGCNTLDVKPWTYVIICFVIVAQGAGNMELDIIIIIIII